MSAPTTPTSTHPDGVEAPPTPGRPWGAILVLVTAVAVFLWLAAVAVSLVLVRAHVLAGEDALGDARDALAAGEVEVADARLEVAADRLGRAATHGTAPHVRLAGRLPGVGPNIATIAAVAESSALVATAGRAATAHVVALPEGLQSLTPRDGTLPVDEIAAAAPLLRGVSDALVEAAETVGASPASGLFAQVADARTRFLATVEPAVHQADVAAALAEQLPALLGADGPRRYVLGAVTPVDLRGSGGFFGAYSIVTVESGRLDIGPFAPTSDLARLPADAVEPADPSIGVRWGPSGGAGYMHNVNMTPDFPSAAVGILRYWQTALGETLDGVIFVDPFVVEALVEVTGPVEVDGIVLEAENVIAYVGNESYAEMDSQRERKEALGEVAAVALARFLEGDTDRDLRATVDPLASAARGGHLLVYAADPQVQAALTLAGVDGRLVDPDEGDFFGVVVNSATGGKVDYFAERTLDYRVRLLDGGRADGRLEVTHRNDAPTEGQPRHVIGPHVDGLDPGDALYISSLYCSARCAVHDAPTDDLGTVRASRELGLRAVDAWIRIPAGTQRTLRYSWRTEGAWSREAGSIVYRLTIRDQVTIRPTTTRVTLEVPDGFVAADLPDGARTEEESGRAVVVWERTGDRGPIDLRFVLDRSR